MVTLAGFVVLVRQHAAVVKCAQAGCKHDAQVATEHLQSIATSFEFSRDNYEPLVRTCMTTLSSKMCVRSFVCLHFAATTCPQSH